VPADLTCRVWWAAPVEPGASPGLVALLDAHERERLDRFRRAADRARYLAAHALTRLVLADVVGRPAATLRFDRTCRCGQQHGKPSHVGGPEFSLTHAGDLVGVAVWPGGPIGLDVEQVREMTDLAGMAGHICSPAELARTPVPSPGAFFTTWTRKEALLKATGDGIALPMSAITLGQHGVESWTGDDAPDGPVWLHDLRPAPGYSAAVAGLGSPPHSVLEHDGRPLLT
jgi:4'-phosphopantetheinyl transferase